MPFASSRTSVHRRSSYGTDRSQTDLSYNCQCNGFTPALSNYLSTIPFFTCNDQYVNCINSHPNDAEEQQVCVDSLEKFCSNYQNASDSSASPAETLTSTATVVTTLPGGQLSTSQIVISFIQPEGADIGQTSAPTSSSPQPPSSQTSPPQPSNSSSTASVASTDSGLSAGEISAAVIVPVLAVLGIVAAVILQIRRSRRKKSSEDDEPWKRKELHGEEVPRKELASSTRWELSTDRADHRHELEGDLAGEGTAEKAEMAANEIAAVETAAGGRRPQ